VRPHSFPKLTGASGISKPPAWMRVLNVELTRAGYAWWYIRYAPGETAIRDAEREAQKAKRGLWSDPNPVAPWDFRRNGGS
jgi:endonuclease YncB( thermonuclease family)